jgi:hypothetical protein
MAFNLFTQSLVTAAQTAVFGSAGISTSLAEPFPDPIISGRTLDSAFTWPPMESCRLMCRSDFDSQSERLRSHDRSLTYIL